MPSKQVNSRDLVQLDGERSNGRGGRKLALNDLERQILRNKAQAAQATALFLGGLTIMEVSKEMNVPHLKLAEYLFDDAYPDWQAAVADRAISMFLDLDSGHSRAQIMERVGLSVHLFNKFLSTKVFEERYSEQFTNIKADPVLQVVQQAIVQDLLPKAISALEEIMTNPMAPASARMRAAVEVMNRSGMRNVEPEASDRHDLATFLKERNLTVNNNTYNVIVPPEYAEAVKQYSVIDDSVVDGEFEDPTSED